MNDRNIWLTFKPPNQIKLVNKKNMETSQTHLASKKSVVLKYVNWPRVLNLMI